MAAGKITPGPVPVGSDTSTYSGYFPIIAWIVVLGMIILAVRTRAGYYIVFLFVVVSIIVVLAVGAPTIAKMMKAGIPSGNVQTGTRPTVDTSQIPTTKLTQAEINTLKQEGILAS